MKIYLGYDSREQAAYKVAEHSIKSVCSMHMDITPLRIDRLSDSGLFRRPVDKRSGRYDIWSNAAASTDFALTRFLTPILAQHGWAVFMDSDIVAMRDFSYMPQYFDPKYAVVCVKHDMSRLTGTKMDGQAQCPYPRKLWSSVMAFNCDHPANKRLTLDDINHRPGRDLHAFFWLHDDEIGDLPPELNWLVGLQPEPDNLARIAHFTLGTPDLPGVGDLPEHSIWWRAHAAATKSAG